MGFDGVWAECIKTAGNAIVKPCADVDHQITIMHRHIGFIKPVHPQHAQPIVTIGRVGAKAHQG